MGDLASSDDSDYRNLFVADGLPGADATRVPTFMLSEGESTKTVICRETARSGKESRSPSFHVNRKNSSPNPIQPSESLNIFNFPKNPRVENPSVTELYAFGKELPEIHGMISSASEDTSELTVNLPEQSPREIKRKLDERSEVRARSIRFGESLDQLELDYSKMRGDYLSGLSKMRRRRRKKKCCIFINDRQSRCLGCLPLSLKSGTKVTSLLVFILAIFQLKLGIDTMQYDHFWLSVSRSFFALVLMVISIIGFMTLKRRHSRGLVFLGASYLVLIGAILMGMLLRLARLIYLCVTQADDIMSTVTLYKVVYRSIFYPTLFGVLIAAASSTKSLACVWDLGGTGREKLPWSKIDWKQNLGHPLMQPKPAFHSIATVKSLQILGPLFGEEEPISAMNEINHFGSNTHSEDDNTSSSSAPHLTFVQEGSAQAFLPE